MPTISSPVDLIPSHEGNDAMLWYFMLRGAASFYEENGRWPGSPCAATVAAAEGGDQQFSPHIVELDMPRFRNHVNRVLTSSGVAVNRVSDDFVHVSHSESSFLNESFHPQFLLCSCLTIAVRFMLKSSS